MPTAPASIAALAEALQAHGLLLRGGFAPRDGAGPDGGDAVPALADGSAARWLALVGVAGSAFWPHFRNAPEAADGQPHPLDRWSRRVGDALAARFDGLALYPFGAPPYQPFPRWADRAEGLHTSPLGLQLHPRYGLWHSYRFALALRALPPDAASARETEAATDLCAHCTGQPCLRACPVGAFTGREYRTDACVDHLASEPAPPCRESGCLARHACPVGSAFAQQPAHARFHMEAFVQAMAAVRPARATPADGPRHASRCSPRPASRATEDPR